MADFSKALVKLLQLEGGWVHNKDDSGGETNYGITRQTALENGYNGSMKDIPRTKVEDIYRKIYWDKLRCGDIQDQDIAEELFDTGVNCGTRTAGEFLQRALNIFNKKEKLYADIAVDGGVGPITIRTLATALAAAGWYRLCILRALDCLQGNRYIELCERKEKHETHAGGWFRNRVGVKD